MTFSERLKELRKKYNLNQAEIANVLNIGQRQISYYENGRDIPPLPSLIRLSNYFGVSLDYLSGRSDNPRHEDFIKNAELELFKEIEKLMQNKEPFDSVNDAKGDIGEIMKDSYKEYKSRYTSPLAHLRIIFATRELANKHLLPKITKVYIKNPEYLRVSNFWLNPIKFLKERGILPQEVIDSEVIDTDLRIFAQRIKKEVDKLEEEYISLNHREETEK